MVKAEDRIFRISRKADKFIRSLPEEKRKSVKEAVRRLTENKTDGLDQKAFSKSERIQVTNR